MQRFDPSGTGRPSPDRGARTDETPDSSPSSDGTFLVHDEVGPSDGSRLAACLAAWAQRRHGRFHYRLTCIAGPGQLPDLGLLRCRLAALSPPLPASWLAALEGGWPPPLPGLHRIELAPGVAWISLAIGLKPAVARRLNARPQRAQATGAANHAVVIGAGLAGCAMADGLLRRGWCVTLIERGPQVGGAVAGIPLLAQHPALSPGNDRRSRLLLSALLVTRRLAARFGESMTWCGRFQPMPFADARRRTAEIPPAIAQPVAVSDAAIHGVGGCEGIWYPGCALADPQGWWRRLRETRGLDLRLSQPVAAIARRGDHWQALDAGGAVIASAAVMVLACQAQALALAKMPPVATGRLRLSRIQVAVGTATALQHRPATILGGSSYRLEKPGRHCVIGPLRPGVDSLTDHPLTLTGLTINDPAYRWHLCEPGERLLLRDSLPMIGAVPDTASIMALRTRYERNDRLPLPRQGALHVLAGLGGRGLLWSVLGAEMIAAVLNDEPPVVEADLEDAVDPARFLKRALRRSQGLAG